jgi:hypothetical protein
MPVLAFSFRFSAQTLATFAYCVDLGTSLSTLL